MAEEILLRVLSSRVASEPLLLRSLHQQPFAMPCLVPSAETTRDKISLHAHALHI